MPVYIHLANLFVDKKAVQKRYSGGINQFRIDYAISDDNYNQEDDYLFSIAKMNVDEFDLSPLIENGLHYDETLNCSNDFTIRPRYGTYLWKCSWIDDNAIFAWHVYTPIDQINKANDIASLSMDDIGVLADKGETPFATITK